MVLVTDGQPNACGVVADVATVAGAGLTGGTIPTFVIGVISPGASCVLDPNPPNQADLDTVAQAGGTTQAFMVDVSSNAIQRFQAALQTIQGSAVFGCQYAVPPPTSGAPLDPASLKVKLTTGGTSTDLPKVANPAACTPSAGGWYFDDPTAPKSIQLCDSTCTALNAATGAQIDLVLACSTSG